MFYVSSLRNNMTCISHAKSSDMVGVTDTDDGVEEMYTVDELASIVDKHRVRIAGFVHTGSFFVLYLFTKDMLRLDSLNKGDFFYLTLPDREKKIVMYVDNDGKWIFFDGDETHSLSRAFLSKYRDCVSLGVTEAGYCKKLSDRYKKLFPLSGLSQFI